MSSTPMQKLSKVLRQNGLIRFMEHFAELLAEELGTRGHLTLASAAPQVEQTLRLVGIERAANIELGDAPGSGVDSIHPG